MSIFWDSEDDEVDEGNGHYPRTGGLPLSESDLWNLLADAEDDAEREDELDRVVLHGFRVWRHW